MAEPPAPPLSLADEQTVLAQHPLVLLFPEDTFTPSSIVTRLEVPDCHLSEHSSVLPPVQDSSIHHIRNSYLKNRIVGSNRLSWSTRASVHSGEHQRIDYVWGTQKLIHKEPRVRSPDFSTSSALAPSPAPLSVPTSASASVLLLVSALVPASAPMSASTDTSSGADFRSLNVTAKKQFYNYVLTERPMRHSDNDKKYVSDVVTRLVDGHVLNPTAWVKKNFNSFWKIALQAFQDFKQQFRTITHLCIHDAYSIVIATDDGTDFHTT
ncbi:hypothetical protein SCLCIDRAFT_27454 [Scleroderma citrinum Foug A]|uniref:Uncharacterized protein n=1 Tax=Scleroderma citrinum Foug A TaxID=1036808 RepID=A0A0C3A3A7_9AGAM|nr:hypothetical protein SCLCIDRAFT_27454 [Scleroderma citrinum Foug A]